MFVVVLALLGCSPDSDGDGILDDVDCDPSDAAVGLASSAFADGDGDGFGQGTATWACPDEEGFSEQPGDCDDADADIHPDADEFCDGLDNNCNGETDEQAGDMSTWFPDHDQDGFGDGSQGLEACSAPTDYIADGQDCDDADSAVNPSGTEICNGVDDDCNGITDDGAIDGAETLYTDADGDGFGDADSPVLVCPDATGVSTDDTDCDDGNAEVHPGHHELCDYVDNSCDGQVDFDGWLPGDYDDLEQVMAEAPSDSHICLGPGTFSGNTYSRAHGISLHGAGVNETIIDALDDEFLVTAQNLTLGFYDLEVRNATARGNYGRGALVQFVNQGDLVLKRVRIQDAACKTAWVCNGGVAYWGGRGSLEAEDLEIDGFVYDPNDGYAWSSFYGLFTGENVDYVVNGMEISNSTFKPARHFYAVSLYVQRGSAQVADLYVHDNTISSADNFGGTVWISNVEKDMSFENITVSRNTISAEQYYFSFALKSDHTSGVTTTRNVEISDNTVSTHSAYAQGMVATMSEGEHTWENVLFHGNSFQSLEPGNEQSRLGGAFYSHNNVVKLSNVDFSDNEFLGFTGGTAAFFYANSSDVDLRNINIAEQDYGDSELLAFVYLEQSTAQGSTLELGYNNLYQSPGPEYWVYDDVLGDLGLAPASAHDPLYTDLSSGDLTLDSGSPLIDAGDPEILDADGSVSDVGAYGGPYGASW